MYEGYKSLIPYYGDRSVRKQIDNLFSRQVLGAVIVGKFFGDYSAIWARRLLGVDGGYITGMVLSVAIFIYWEKLDSIGQEGKKKAGEAKEKAKEKTGEVKEKAEEKKDEVTEGEE